MIDPPRLSDTILLADDEPYNLGWLVEFIRSKKYKTRVAESVDAALTELQNARFRMIVCDLSIPYSGTAGATLSDPIFGKYPGLAVANYARNHNHTDRQVVVYSVHDDAAVRDFTSRLRCTYLLKGRPRQFKEELLRVLEYDPMATAK